MDSWTRIGLALVLGFFIATFISFVNGRDVVSALLAGFGFAVLVGVIVAILSWGMDRAVEKGYPGWFGFFLALFLNVVGLIILALLPAYTPRSKPPVAR
jgi:FtsH-binding integral membrane protein